MYNHEMHLATKFTLTADMVKLVRGLCIGWNKYCDYGDDLHPGAPGASERRPFGNSSYLDDIGEILGFGRPNEYNESLSKERYWQLVREFEAKAKAHYLTVAMALKIILEVGSFEPGEFVRQTSFHQWQRKTEIKADANKQS